MSTTITTEKRKLVEQIRSDFARGGIAAVLGGFSDDINWHVMGLALSVGLHRSPGGLSETILR